MQKIVRMNMVALEHLNRSAAAALGDWWQDDRRNWCAYCGIPMRRSGRKLSVQPPSLATRDHVIPKAHNGGRLTIPACRECNVAKGAMSLPEYLVSRQFLAKRKNRHRHQWPVGVLWATSGIAALKIAIAVGAAVKLDIAASGADTTADRTR